MTDTNQLNWQRTNLENIETAWEGDLWNRKRLGIQLTNYVDRLQCGAVLALDARWGEGKTWFVRHWQKHLEEALLHKDLKCKAPLIEPNLRRNLGKWST